MSTMEAPGRRYRIAEVAQLTGFTPTTLRFYEDAGVLGPAERTAAGYRVYSDRDVERLRLIARAKDLGCTLEEIAGLVQAWEADECGPVKHRLRALVNAKVIEVQQHIATQVAFAAQLQATAAVLAGRPMDGPCDDTCGCATATTEPAAADPSTVDAPGASSDSGSGSGSGSGCGTGCGCATVAAEPSPVPLVAQGTESGPVPIACSLGAGDIEARIADWQAVVAHVTGRQTIPNGVRLVFGPGAPLGEISRLASAEHECCPFFAFAITVDHRGVALEVTAPDDGQVLLDAVFGAVA